MKNKILLSLFLLLNPFFISGNNRTDDKNYAEEVNTLIGTKGLGLASGLSLSRGDLSFWDGTVYSILFFKKCRFCNQPIEWSRL